MMKPAYSASIFVLLFLSTFVSLPVAADPQCLLKLAYKSKGKPGYMAPAPSNAGLYRALYIEIARNINCELEILRFPKKRTLYAIEQGIADIYPSTGFDPARSEYMFYIPNGLHRHEPYIGLTPTGIENITNIRQLNKYDLTWIYEAGTTTIQLAQKKGVKSEGIYGLRYKQALEMIQNGRPVFYRMIKGNYTDLLEKENSQDLSHLGIQSHHQCCAPKSQKLYLGFSRRSSFYTEENNSKYDASTPRSATNFPVKLSKNSIAYKISKELARLETSGRVQTLFTKYIIEPGHTP